MMSGGNWWRANDISIGHLTREREVGDRWRDKTFRADDWAAFEAIEEARLHGRLVRLGGGHVDDLLYSLGSGYSRFPGGAFAGRRKEFAHALRTGRERLTAVEPRDLATASRLTLTLRRPRPYGAFVPIYTNSAFLSATGRPVSTLADIPDCRVGR
jgi:hypothetical protein